MKLKYEVIKSKSQYLEYNKVLRKLWENPNSNNLAERELLELLIETWEKKKSTRSKSDPVQLIKFLMNNHGISRQDLMEILNIQKGTLSKILNYKCGLSKDIIRKLSEHFKVSQDAFNRPYKIESGTSNTGKKEKILHESNEMEWSD